MNYAISQYHLAWFVHLKHHAHMLEKFPLRATGMFHISMIVFPSCHYFPTPPIGTDSSAQHSTVVTKFISGPLTKKIWTFDTIQMYLRVVQNGLIQKLPLGCPKLRGGGWLRPLLDNVDVFPLTFLDTYSEAVK